MQEPTFSIMPIHFFLIVAAQMLSAFATSWFYYRSHCKCWDAANHCQALLPQQEFRP
ncbi:hypothetical protein [Oryzomonas sp.]|uniref:hypothetical protein n=1 Tax=Oryzomonas sp. TaxID=2855186 RepID=UPI00285297F7|nr:hypothetical protein [Oryzomonas sp.]